MSHINVCEQLHVLFNSLPRLRFPFNERNVPKNGIYVLFEDNEKAHGGDRIVRVGTHTGEGQLRSRLKQHFIDENKDRSIFRKNIGRALLNRENDPFLKIWEYDLTTVKAKRDLLHTVDMHKQRAIEKEVSTHIQNNISCVVFEIDDASKRLEFESKIISSISACESCKASAEWLGNFSPKEKIRESGLWLVNELGKTQLGLEELEELKKLV